MAKKTKGWLDNYGEEANANEGSSSAPKEWRGEGYSNVGRNYSPAWGGQFAIGGKVSKAQKGKKVIIDGKEYDTASEEYIDMFDKGLIGTMQDGNFWGNKSTLQPIVLYSSRDKDTQKFFNKFKEDDLEQYETLIELQKRYGHPHITLKDKPGFFDPSSPDNSEKMRAHYNANDQRMYLSDTDGTYKLKEDYLAELAHQKQVLDKGALDFNLRGLSGLGRTAMNMIKNFESPTDAYKREYETPGNLEYEAHEEIQPKLEDEYNDIYWDKLDQYNYYKNPGTFSDSKPTQTYNNGGQFAMGGSLPGSVGFTYARTNSPAPSEGPYAKKTMPSAQNGQEMRYYQEGLDWKPKTISKNGSSIEKGQVGTLLTVKGTPTVPSEGTPYNLDFYESFLPMYKETYAPPSNFGGDIYDKIFHRLQDEKGYDPHTASRITSFLNKTYETSGEIKDDSFFPTDTLLRTEAEMSGNKPKKELTKEEREARQKREKELGVEVYNAGGMMKAQTGFELVTGIKPITSVTNSGESVSTGVQKRDAKLENDLRVEEKRQRQGQVSQTRPNTVAEEAERIRKNKAYASTHPYATVDEQGNLSAAQSDRTMEGKALPNTTAAGIDKGMDHMQTAMDIAGAITGAGELTSLGVKALKDKAINSAGKAVVEGAQNLTSGSSRGILGKINDELIYPIKYKKQIAQLESQLGKSLETLNTPEGRKRLEDLGINPDHIFNETPLIVSNPRTGSAYYPDQNIINVNMRDAKRLGATPQQIIEHELGHNIQGASRASGQNSMTVIDENAQHIDLKDPQTLSDLEAMTHFQKEQYVGAKLEGMPFLREMRQDMLERGLIKNQYDPINASIIDAYLKSDSGQRFKKLMDNSAVNYRIVPSIMNSMPVVAGAVAGAAALEQKKKGGVIKDDRGYWNPDNWGEVVEIDSPYITMKGVNKPLLGISDTGDVQYMEPGQDYEFDGNKVREFPMMQNYKQGGVASNKGYYNVGMGVPRFDEGGEDCPCPEFNCQCPPGYGTATRADSLRLYQGALAQQNWFKNHPEYTIQKNPDRNITRNKILSELELTRQSKDRDVKSKKYYNNIDKNRFEQRELTIGFVNKNVPIGVYDRRIQPNAMVTYQGYNMSPINNLWLNDGFDENVRDVVETPQYDPIYVAPWNILKPKEQQERLKKYGFKGTPYDPSLKLKPQIKPVEPTLKPRPFVPATKIPMGEPSQGMRIRERQMPQIGERPIQTGEYKVSYYDPEIRDWNERDFMTEAESQQFMNEMSQRGFGPGYGNVTQRRVINKKEEGGLVKAQDGERQPIYTDDPKKVKDYQDSVRLNKEYPFMEGANKVGSSSPGDMFMLKKLHPEYFANKKNQPIAAAVTRDHDIYEYKNMSPTDVFLGKMQNQVLGPMHAKPVQPYILKEEPKLKGKVSHVNKLPMGEPSTGMGIRERQMPNISAPNVEMSGPYMAGYTDYDTQQGIDRGFRSAEERDAFVEELRKRPAGNYQPGQMNISSYYDVNKRKTKTVNQNKEGGWLSQYK
jgi:hypothetical protein